MAEVSRVVLFDIDGTLVHSGRAGFHGMNAAFEALYGVAGALEGVPLAGRTDRAIVTDVLQSLGREATDDAVVELREAYLGHLAQVMSRPVPGAQVLPGVAGAIDRLRAMPDVAVGLLTGNFARGAEIKLGYFDLWSPFAFGAFGDAHVSRRDLVPVAHARAAARGIRVPVERLIVIGDTPLDVDCARAHGARSVGVATGGFAAADLAAAKADLVIETLEDLDALDRLLQL